VCTQELVVQGPFLLVFYSPRHEPKAGMIIVGSGEDCWCWFRCTIAASLLHVWLGDMSGDMSDGVYVLEQIQILSHRYGLDIQVVASATTVALQGGPECHL
jgi:hypothetical protein